MKKLRAIYSIFMGVSMIGMWIVFYLSNNIPELETNPAEISLHIFIEISTALLLIFSGILIILKKKLANNFYLLSSGMLLYSIVNSSGYFIDKGDIAFGLMFGAFLIFLIIFVIPIVEGKNNEQN